MSPNLSLAIFISGTGTNLQALLTSPERAHIKLVVSSKVKAFGFLKAKSYGVPTLALDRQVDWEQLDQDLKKLQINGILLLGFMKIVPPSFISQWVGRIWNLHPSLLPLHKGMHAIENSFQEGSSMGISIHEATAEMDAGPILLQRKVTKVVRDKIADNAEARFRISLLEQNSVQLFVKRLIGYYAYAKR